MKNAISQECVKIFAPFVHAKMTQTSRINFASEQKFAFIKVIRVIYHYDIIFCYVQNRTVINNFSKFQ